MKFNANRAYGRWEMGLIQIADFDGVRGVQIKSFSWWVLRKCWQNGQLKTHLDIFIPYKCNLKFGCLIKCLNPETEGGVVTDEWL